MKLHWSPRSPYVRKVMIVAHEKGLAHRIHCVRTVVGAFAVNEELFAVNPLGRIPTLVLDDGEAVYDSPVICEALDGLSPTNRLFPEEPTRQSALTRQALGDGLMDLLVGWRVELLKPGAQRSPEYIAASEAKFWKIMDALERGANAFEGAAVDIGHIAIACGLRYADFRFGEFECSNSRPRLAAWIRAMNRRPSFVRTEFVDD